MKKHLSDIVLGGATMALLTAATPSSSDLRVLAFGGSVGPDQTPLDLERALQPLDGRVDRLLFAGGDRRLPAVQIEDPVAPQGLRAQLGRVLGWGVGLGSTYRPTRLRQLDGPARRDTIVQATLDLASARPASTLLLLGVGHGALSPEGDRTELMLWGADLLTVDDLATALDDAAPRARVALVLGHCYGGDFARIAYRQASPEQGLAPRCALLATTADRLADGCSPRRDAGPTFVGRIADLLARPDRRWDLDGDGALSLAELHLASLLLDDSVNVPVLSTERLLADRVPPEAADTRDVQSLQAVMTAATPLQAEAIRRLAASLQLPLTRPVMELRRRAASQRERLDQIDALRQDYLDQQEASRQELVDAIAQRWPSLLNPFRADFEAELARARPQLEALLREHPAAHDFFAYDKELSALEAWLDPRLRDEARRQRLLRSVDTALRWQALDTTDRRDLQAVLACEHQPLTLKKRKKTQAPGAPATPATR